MSVILFLLIISVLVFVHELGHFIFAKKSGVRVDEFAIGFPPRLFAKKVGETTYAINLIPFGGYVKIFGESPNEESISGPDSHRSFVNKNRGIQAMILFAGVLFNFIFAWLLLSIGFMIGTPTENDKAQANIVVTNVLPNTPASESGIMIGDELRSLVVGNLFLEAPFDAVSVREFISSSKGENIKLSVMRQGEEVSLSVKAKEGITQEGFALGLEMSEASITKLPFFKAIYESFFATISITKATFIGIVSLIWSAPTFNGSFDHVAGPVGIVSMVGDATRFGLAYVLTFTSLISINLAVLNLIPFPALDGGRLLFVLIESIRRKSISPKVANTINGIGFALLLIFMIAISVSDIGKLFK